MEYAAVLHKSEKTFCYAIGNNHFRFRIQVKKGDMSHVWLHFRDKYLPLEFMDTRDKKEMRLYASDAVHDYYETDLVMDVVCLRYFFELVDAEGRHAFYGNYDFYDGEIADIENMFDCPQNLREEERFVVPQWAKNAVFYQIFPSRFATTKEVGDEVWYKAPISAHDNLQGDLRGIINKLDHLKALGVDVIYMTPLFYSDSCHKYDTIDYYRIDPSFGDKEDLRELVQKAHAQGMYVVLDGVFNHTAPEFFAFRDIMEKQSDSAYLDWYYVDGFPLVREWGKRPNFKTFSYFGGMPKLNLSNRKVQDYVIDVAAYWMRECAVDGFRLDVGDEISHNFWKRFRKEVKAVNPEALIIGEVWHYAGDFLEGDEWDTVMDYPFYKALKALVAEEQIPVSEFCARIGFLKGTVHEEVFPLLLNMMDSHDTERFLHSCGYDKRKQRLAAAMLLLAEGMPMIYYGDEVAMEGANDPDCRRGMLWDEKRQDAAMLAWYKRLVFLRKNCPQILGGRTVRETVDDERGILWIEKEKDGERVHLLYHTKDTAAEVPELGGHINLLTGQPFSGVLMPYEAAVLT